MLRGGKKKKWGGSRTLQNSKKVARKQWGKRGEGQKG